MKRLTDIGFLKVGSWFIENNQLEHNISSFSSEKNILYCFVCNDNIKYIGKTVKTVSQRMYGYKKPSISQRTNYRVNKEIKESLKNESVIDIYILTDKGLLKFKNFRINIAAGLEDTLIAEIKPKWNLTGKKLSVLKISEKKTQKTQKNIMNDCWKFKTEILIDVKIGQAYYNDGFFNIKAKYSSLFGPNKSLIQVQLGEDIYDIVEGYVNRTANGKNGYPRIMIGKKYTSWIKSNFNQGDVLKVRMTKKDYIVLIK